MKAIGLDTLGRKGGVVLGRRCAGCRRPVRSAGARPGASDVRHGVGCTARRRVGGRREHACWTVASSAGWAHSSRRPALRVWTAAENSGSPASMAASRPLTDQGAGRARRSGAWSVTSSWIRLALRPSSTATAAGRPLARERINGSTSAAARERTCVLERGWGPWVSPFLPDGSGRSHLCHGAVSHHKRRSSCTGGVNCTGCVLKSLPDVFCSYGFQWGDGEHHWNPLMAQSAFESRTRSPGQGRAGGASRRSRTDPIG